MSLYVSLTSPHYKITFTLLEQYCSVNLCTVHQISALTVLQEANYFKICSIQHPTPAGELFNRIQWKVFNLCKIQFIYLLQLCRCADAGVQHNSDDQIQQSPQYPADWMD